MAKLTREQITNAVTQAWEEMNKGSEYTNAVMQAWQEMNKSNDYANAALQAMKKQEPLKEGFKENFGKTKLPISGRDIYHVNIPISKSLSARLGVGPNGNIIKRIKDPKIDMKNDMIYMGINYKF